MASNLANFFSATSDESGHNAQALSFVYPYGATLNVAKPATAVLSTGTKHNFYSSEIRGFLLDEMTW